MRFTLLFVLLAMSSGISLGGTQLIDKYDKVYWQAIIANDFALPGDTTITMLLPVLNGYLASPDPELRDEIGYTVLTQWVYVKQLVPPEVLRELIAEWRKNLSQGIGEQDTDSVLRRSFSALMLSVAVAYDNKNPYLSDAEFDQLLQAALTYLHAERDVRGFDADKGWLHSVAHTADLLKFLGRSRYIEAKDQGAILTAIADKLKTVGQPLVQGEDERLARAVLAIVARLDADMPAFNAFLDSLKLAPLPNPPTAAALAIRQNQKHFVMALYAVLATDPRELESLDQARARVRELLGTMM